ncbi:MAG: bifunctional phosphopantothenoylcysteine decarboxylase/phosphopantothenate--cysteine ligase CoaBC [Bacillota bacterium]
MILRGKTIVVGVCGGIAAYKVVDLVSRLKKEGAGVQVIMTEAATKMVAPLTFEAISGHPVRMDLLATGAEWAVDHIALAEGADLMVIAPATANIIGKMAAGIADDYLTTEVVAATCPILVVPAMNHHMYANPLVQANIRRLQSVGFCFMEPAYGPMAEAGQVGRGRLPEPPEILDAIRRMISEGPCARRAGIEGLGGAEATALPVGTASPASPPAPRAAVGDLSGFAVLVTAGATREPLDPVRFLSNRATGKMGYALAEAARDRGARVVVVSGPVAILPPYGVEMVFVTTAQEMYDAVVGWFDRVDAVIGAAAVADYRAAQVSPHKIKKGEGPLTLTLERNPDILSELGRRRSHQVLVGFAAETDALEAHARDKLVRKNLDVIVANDVTAPGAGFGTDTNVVTLFRRDGHREEVPKQSKRAVAERIMDHLSALLHERRLKEKGT